MSSRFMSRLVGSGLAVCAVFGACSATALAGPIRSKVTVSSKTLKPGVVFTHLRITVKGAWGVQNVYKLSWPIGDRHVRLHSSLLGTYNASSGFIVDHGISHLASAGAPAGMIAAMTGDYSVYEGWQPVTSRTSGMLVQNRQVFRIGAGGPAVGYQPDGRFIMGTPMVRPAKIKLPGVDVTVGAQNPGPCKPRSHPQRPGGGLHGRQSGDRPYGIRRRAAAVDRPSDRPARHEHLREPARRQQDGDGCGVQVHRADRRPPDGVDADREAVGVRRDGRLPARHGCRSYPRVTSLRSQSSTPIPPAITGTNPSPPWSLENGARSSARRVRRSIRLGGIRSRM